MVDERQRSAAAAVSATCKIKAINLNENLFLFFFFLVLLIVKEFVPMTLVQIRQKTKCDQELSDSCTVFYSFQFGELLNL